MQSAVRAGARLIGVNNRNLKDFTVDLGNAARLREGAPDGTVFVAESGVSAPADAAALRKTGADAVLAAECADKHRQYHIPGQVKTSAQAQGAVTQWLNFLDEVEHRYKGLRVTNFSIADYDYVANNTQAVSTNLITGTLEIYMCVSDKEADA